MEQDFAKTTDHTSANLDLNNLGEFAPDNEFQQVDIKTMKRYWEGVEPTNPFFKNLKTMHLELFDLVIEDEFLKRIAETRKEMKDSDHYQPDEADEDILPSRP